ALARGIGDTDRAAPRRHGIGPYARVRRAIGHRAAAIRCRGARPGTPGRAQRHAPRGARHQRDAAAAAARHPHQPPRPGDSRDRVSNAQHFGAGRPLTPISIYEQVTLPAGTRPSLVAELNVQLAVNTVAFAATARTVHASKHATVIEYTFLSMCRPSLVPDLS